MKLRFSNMSHNKTTVSKSFKRNLIKFSDSASVFRCFPPSPLGASSLNEDHHNDSSSNEDDQGDSSSNEDQQGDSEKGPVTQIEGLTDCAPQESPVAEAGPGVSYPGYKQYCR